MKKAKSDVVGEAPASGGLPSGPRTRVTMDFDLEELYLVVSGLMNISHSIKGLSCAHAARAKSYDKLMKKFDTEFALLHTERRFEPMKLKFDGEWSLAT